MWGGGKRNTLRVLGSKESGSAFFHCFVLLSLAVCEVFEEQEGRYHRHGGKGIAEKEHDISMLLLNNGALSDGGGNPGIVWESRVPAFRRFLSVP